MKNFTVTICTTSKKQFQGARFVAISGETTRTRHTEGFPPYEDVHFLEWFSDENFEFDTTNATDISDVLTAYNANTEPAEQLHKMIDYGSTVDEIEAETIDEAIKLVRERLAGYLKEADKREAENARFYTKPDNPQIDDAKPSVTVALQADGDVTATETGKIFTQSTGRRVRVGKLGLEPVDGWGSTEPEGGEASPSATASGSSGDGAAGNERIHICNNILTNALNDEN